MSKNTADQKDRSKIFYSVLSLEISKGHLKWRVADLARLAGVSRPLVYYHFGKSKDAILERCVRIVAEEYFGLDDERSRMLAEGRAYESLLKTRQIFLKHPSLTVFYQKWRTQVSPLQKLFIQIEKDYQRKLARAFPQLSASRILVVHALYHGLVTAPFLTPEALREGSDAVLSIIAQSPT